MGTKGIIFTAAMAEYLMRFPPHLRGMYMLALYRYCFCGAYAENKPSWCREWLDLAEAEQEGKEIRIKKRRTLKEAEYRQILSYLNDKTGRDFRITDTFRDRVDARIREGAKIEDFMAVVDNASAAWAGDPKMRMYLRPETLFGTKFDTYRAQGSGGFCGGSSFETDSFMEDALKQAYGDDYDEIFGKGKSLKEMTGGEDV